MPLGPSWSSDKDLDASMSYPPTHYSALFARLRSTLAPLEKLVQKNHADFQALLLTVAYLEHVYWRDEIVAQKRLTREEAASLIKNIAARDRTLADALSKDWDQGRFPDSEAKTMPLFGFEPKDQLVYEFQKAADYSASLEAHPDRFFELLKASKPA